MAESGSGRPVTSGPAAPTLHLSRRAMATRFELWLAGEDAEHLEAVGHAALDEVARVEQLLSRFDPAAEIARVNREAPLRPTRVDPELFGILEHCRRLHQESNGYFDICAPSFRSADGEARVSFAEAVWLDPETRMIGFTRDPVRLDLGGYGKGYALDMMARVLDRYGVAAALMHGGTSSVLARGERREDTPWRVGIRDPFRGDDAHVAEIPLQNSGFSYSAVNGGRGEGSDIVDPHTGEPLREQAGCVVISADATEAEVLSTALLAMGRERAGRFAREQAWPSRFRAGWIDRTEGEVALQWLHEHPGA